MQSRFRLLVAIIAHCFVFANRWLILQPDANPVTDMATQRDYCNPADTFGATTEQPLVRMSTPFGPTYSGATVIGSIRRSAGLFLGSCSFRPHEPCKHVQKLTAVYGLHVILIPQT